MKLSLPSLSTRIRNQINYIREILERENIGVLEKHEVKRDAAVMIILTPIDNQLNILFTHRTNSVRTHKDQVSLPGGLMEAVDKNLLSTAIRETNEEIGLLVDVKEIIGSLTPVKSITDYFIQPFICFKPELDVIRINRSEVTNLFLVPMDWILNASNRHYEKIITQDGKERSVIFYSPYQTEVIWGITANLMVNFGDLLNL